MTIEQCIGQSADALEAMSQAELETIFAPCLDVTRPERNIGKQSRATRSSGSAGNNVSSDKKAKLREKLRGLGMDDDLGELGLI